MKKVFVVALTVLVASSLTQAQYKGLGWSTGYCFLSNEPLIPADYRAFTHLVNFTAMVSSTQTMDSSFLYLKSRLFVDSCHYHGIRALIGIGGAGCGANIASACSLASKQTNLVSNIMSIMKKYNYDGVDVDWEDGVIDSSAYVGLFKQIRDSINLMTPRPLLTAPVAYWMPQPLGAMFRYVDMLNFMTYDDPAARLGPCFARAVAMGVPKSLMGVGFGWGQDNEVTDPKDILAKCRYAIDSGFGGVNAWQISRAPLVTPWILDSISYYAHRGLPLPQVPVPAKPDSNATNMQPDLTLSWGGAGYAVAYNVQLYNSPDFTTGRVVDSALASTSLEVKGLSAGTAYFWRVNSLNHLGQSAWSPVWTFTTAPATSALPAKSGIFVSGMNASSSSVRFSVSKVTRVVVRLYRVSGTLVETVCNSVYAPGLYRISLKSSRLAPGNYLLDFKDGTYGGARKMIVLE